MNCIFITRRYTLSILLVLILCVLDQSISTYIISILLFISISLTHMKASDMYNQLAMIDSVREGMFKTDSNFELLYTNKEFRDIFEVKHSNNTYLSDYIKDNGVLNKLRDNKVAIEETVGIRSSGEFPISVNAIGNTNGTRFVGSIKDITAEKRLANQKLQVSKLHSLGHMATGVAHHCGSALQTVLNNISSIVPSSEKDKAALQNAREAVLQCGELTSNLLAYAHTGEEVEGESVDINALTKSVCLLAKTLFNNRLQFSTSFESGKLTSVVNKSKLRIAINNIIVNAKDAIEMSSKSISRVKVKVTAIDNEDAYLTLFGEMPAGSYVKILISDTGDGIPIKILPRIFDPYYTTKPTTKGTGLGLSEVYSIVKSSNAFLEIDTNKDGTTIIMYYKLDVPYGHIKEDGSVKIDANTVKRVLIVDDCSSVSILFKHILEHRYGFVVDIAESGEDGLSMYMQTVYSLVFTDMHMPEMDGMEFFNKLRQYDKNAQVIIITCYGADMKVQRMMQGGAAGLLLKPIQNKQLDSIFTNRGKENG